MNVIATLLNICCRFYVPLHACCPFKGPSWWVHNCIMCVVSGMRYGRIYLACLCIYSDVPVSLSGSTAWLWIRVFCHKSWVQDRAWQLFHAAAFLYISVWMQWFMFYLLLDQTSYGPSFWNIYPNISNGQRTQRIFDSYQNLDSWGLCPLEPTVHPLRQPDWSVLMSHFGLCRLNYFLWLVHFHCFSCTRPTGGVLVSSRLRLRLHLRHSLDG